MRILDVTPEYNNIQIYRLEALRRALKSFDAFDKRALSVIRIFEDLAERWMGVEPDSLPKIDTIQRALNGLKRKDTPESVSELKKIQEGFRVNYVLPDNIAGILKEHLDPIVAQDVENSRLRHEEYLEKFAGLLSADIKISRKGSSQRTRQDQMLSYFREKHFAEAYRNIPETRHKEADLFILNTVQKRYDLTLKSLDRAIAAKRKLQKQGDIEHPIISNIKTIAETLNLSQVEQDLLLFYSENVRSPIQEAFADMRGLAWLGDDFYQNLSILTGHDPQKIKVALSDSSQLREANLLAIEIPEDKEKPDQSTKDNPFARPTGLPPEHNYFIPTVTMRALKKESSGIQSLISALVGEDNPRNGYTLKEDFSDAAGDTRRVVGVMVKGLLEPMRPGRKGRSISGPAGGGKNTLSDVIARESARILNTHHGMDVTVKTVLVAMATTKDAYGRMKTEQLSGKDRVHAHKTADVMAAKINEKVLRDKKGEFIILVIDEADRDYMNPKLTGSAAEGGIKDIINFHLLNLKTSCLLLANASHPEQEHITRRVGPGIFLSVQPYTARMRTIQKYCDKAGFEFTPEVIDDLTKRFADTPGVIEACVEDV